MAFRSSIFVVWVLSMAVPTKSLPELCTGDCDEISLVQKKVNLQESPFKVKMEIYWPSCSGAKVYEKFVEGTYNVCAGRTIYTCNNGIISGTLYKDDACTEVDSGHTTSVRAGQSTPVTMG